jgi:hypothetical protein
MSTRRTIGVLVVLAAAFLAGVVWQRYQLPPYRLLWSLKGRLAGPAAPTAGKPAAMTDFLELGEPVDSLIDIRSVGDALAARSRLRTFLWGADSLPTLVPEVEPDYSDPRWTDLEGLDRIDRLVVRMDFGLESIIYHFHPTSPNGTLVLYHQGHRGDFFKSKSRIQALVARGYAVAGLSMPLQGMNNQPVVSFPGLGTVRLRQHRHMEYLEPAKGHPLRYFLEPVIAVINGLGPEYDGRVDMVGISGGGWTATVAAAIDPRILISIPVADSNPFYLRFERHWGDWEETVPALYRIANYLELHVLGASGDGREQLEILNAYDPCCHQGIGADSYADVVRDRVAALDGGSWRLFVDDSHREHVISDVAIDTILNVLDRQ